MHGPFQDRCEYIPVRSRSHIPVLERPGRGHAWQSPTRSRSVGARGVWLAATFAVCVHLIAASAPAWGDGTESAGDVLRVALPAAAFVLTVRRDDRDGRRQLYRAFAANVGATWALKEIVDKERPDGTDDDAFPSGHASMAFQGAAFIHRRYGLKPAWPAYALAAFTAWTRVDADEHDEADVVAGAALGIASSFLLAERRNVAVSASLDGDSVGLRITGYIR